MKFEYSIHYAHNIGWGISQPNKPNLELSKVKTCSKGNHWDVLFPDLKLMFT